MDDFSVREQPDSQNGGQTVSESLNGPAEHTWRTLAELTLVSESGDEKLASEGARAVMEVARDLDLTASRLAELKSAVTRAVLNAADQGRQSEKNLSISLRVLISENLAGSKKSARSGRGWGFFLIEKMTYNGSGQPYPTVELFLYREGNL